MSYTVGCMIIGKAQLDEPLIVYQTWLLNLNFRSFGRIAINGPLHGHGQPYIKWIRHYHSLVLHSFIHFYCQPMR
jgi:hypothetical protein